MAFDLKLNIKLSQQLVMTPQLQQAIKLLQLNRQELVEMVNQELVENPTLEEMGESGPDEPIEGEPPSEYSAEHDTETPATPEQQASPEGEAPSGEEIDWSRELDELNQSYTGKTSASMREINEELPSFESALTKTTTLEDHLNWQLSMTQLTDSERRFGELVIGNLSDDGYLTGQVEDMAREAKLDPEDAEEILKLIQGFDPLGCGSRNLSECLMVQAKLMNPRQPLLERVIEHHLEDLQKKNYPAVAKALGISVEKVIEITKVIMELEPKPGRGFQSGDIQYITPDIYVYKVGNEFSVVLNDEGLPRLKISPYYRRILQDKSLRENKQTKDYVQEKLKSALWLIRSIHNRQKTIFKVMEAIVKRQRDFFDKGVEALRPMILKDIAEDIGMHESTISRVTTNKYVHTPVGIFELKYFFNSSINATEGGDSVASEAVKQKIKQICSKEDPKRPISDQKIVELLRQDGIDIARRTVAKYREMLGILSSSKRKKLF